MHSQNPLDFKYPHPNTLLDYEKFDRSIFILAKDDIDDH
jgi:hypothetical protein